MIKYKVEMADFTDGIGIKTEKDGTKLNSKICIRSY